MENREKPTNPDKLRQDLDSGVGADKVSFPDPAAAPLGTDDEASGHPITPEQLATAPAHETRSTPKATTVEPAWAVPTRKTTGRGMILAAVVVLMVVVVLLVMWMM